MTTPTLQYLTKLALAILPAAARWRVWSILPAYAQGPCFVETSGDNTTDFDTAVQTALSPRLLSIWKISPLLQSRLAA